jgi:hypothetical protein
MSRASSQVGHCAPVTDAERYVRLGLQAGRLEEGLVDAYFGPPELADGPPLDRDALVTELDALLGDLQDGWLRDQVAGLRTWASPPPSYADEVEGCYGVRPTHTGDELFAGAHQRLEALLPGPGSLHERHARWRERQLVPADRVEATVAAVIERAREATRRLVDLAAGEGVELATIRDQPWLAFCHYRGGLRSRIEVNVDLPLTAMELLRLTMHETYPGHHTERVMKEGPLEQTIVLVPTPQSLISEGIAEAAPLLLLQSGAGRALAAAVRDEAGIDFELDRALAIEDAAELLRWAEVDAALMLHEDGADPDEVRAYLHRWSLMSPELVDHMLRYFREPSSRTYIIAPVAGGSLCQSYCAGRHRRLRRLLTEQVRVADLRVR